MVVQIKYIRFFLIQQVRDGHLSGTGQLSGLLPVGKEARFREQQAPKKEAFLADPTMHGLSRKVCS
jgi:hypothetical protein